ncbi:hypothetical protein ABES23_06100 [Peribacillus frigoritolerans]|uniref:hypothetical protein n=1 Tax=Peribacillus frigoritolerans TaxID=450367 RepID=UPI003D2B3E0A
MKTKKCNGCGEIDQSKFYDCYRTLCMECKKRKQYAYNDENPDYLKAKNQRRAARLKYLPNTLSSKQWTNAQKRFGGKCAISDSTDTVLEHVIPSAWYMGGTTVENCIPMDAKLNLSKRDKNIIEWVQQPEIEPLINWKKFYAAMRYLAELNGLTLQEYYAFINWCERNKRTEEEAKAATMTSIEEWKAAGGRI